MTENGIPHEIASASSRRTRRQLLAGGVAAAGVLAADALGRAAPAAAADGDPILMGTINESTSTTLINNSGGDTTFTVAAASGGTALDAEAVDGTAVFGASVTGRGVSGMTQDTAPDAAAVYGEVNSINPGAYSAGVRGQHDGTGGVGIGVYGSHAGDGWGVYGTSQGGIGVVGSVTSGAGTGVQGSGTTGVFGVTDSPHGAGVLAQNNGGGPALQVDGVAAFSRSGMATVPAGKSHVTHWLPLSSASLVLATIQGNVTDLWVRGVTIAAGSPGSFTIHLSKAAESKVKVAWLAVN